MFTQNELVVNDFLANDDPRSLAEDLTDRFDHTFLIGDLNFRLEVSRLHAEWLVSRKDYAQAIVFDELRKLMRHGTILLGFDEADIDFPPTFKYDLMRIPKSSSTMPTRDFYEEPDDAASLASSNLASFHSRHLSEQEDDHIFWTRVLRASTGDLVQKVKGAAAKQKAKTRWLARGSSTPPSPFPDSKSISSMPTPSHSKWGDKFKSSSQGELNRQNASAFSSRVTFADPSVLETSSTKSSLIRKSVVPGWRLSRTDLSGSGSDGEADDDRGVYDSFSKNRVPSW